MNISHENHNRHGSAGLWSSFTSLFRTRPQRPTAAELAVEALEQEQWVLARAEARDLVVEPNGTIHESAANLGKTDDATHDTFEYENGVPNITTALRRKEVFGDISMAPMEVTDMMYYALRIRFLLDEWQRFIKHYGLVNDQRIVRDSIALRAFEPHLEAITVQMQIVSYADKISSALLMQIILCERFSGFNARREAKKEFAAALNVSRNIHPRFLKWHMIQIEA